MRSLTVLFLTLILVTIAFASSVRRSTAASAALVQAASRCTRLTFQKPVKPKKGEAAPAFTPGSRCVRLSGKGKPGKILPNLPPNVGLASSTSYISTNATEQVDLNAIACDADGDTLLYTYSATGGRISGDGAMAKWDLAGVRRPGSYTVTVEVDDGCGCITFNSAVVTLE